MDRRTKTKETENRLMNFMHIDVTKKHNLAMAVAKQKAELVAKQLSGPDIGDLQAVWSGDVLNFQVLNGIGKGVKGHLAVTPTTITVHIELTITTLAGKSVITSSVEKHLKAAGVA